MNEIIPKISIDEIINELNSKSLILYNDDINDFLWVISCLAEICNHSIVQAEQCAHIVHYKGKCNVKSGSYDDLAIMHRELSNKNLTVEIQ